MSKKINLEILTAKLNHYLSQSNSYSSGNLIALLGNLAGVSNPLADTAEKVLYKFYVPTKNARSKLGAVRAEKVLDYDMLQKNMNKLGQYRYNSLLKPAYNLRMDTRDIYSDQYLAQDLARNPKFSAISLGLTTGQYKAQMLDNKDFVLNESKLVRDYLKQGEDIASREPVNSIEAEDAYNKLTPKEMEEWKSDHKTYYRNYQHQMFLAETLWDDHILPEDERSYWETKFGYISGKEQFIKDWVSRGEQNKEYERQHPVLTDEDKSNEEELFNQNWYIDEDGPKEYWMHSHQADICKMNDFFGMGEPLDAGKNDAYLREQAFLQKIEAENAKNQPVKMSLEDSKALYQQVYEQFTKGDFSFLSTKEYLAMKQAVKEAASAYVNDMKTSKTGKWAPSDSANDIACKLMPLFDSAASRLEELSDPEADPRDYKSILKLTQGIQKNLKRGSSDDNLKELRDTLSKCNDKCIRYMQDHRKPSIFHWNANRRYAAIEKLHKGIEKRLTAVNDALNETVVKNNRDASKAEQKLDIDRKTVQTARAKVKAQAKAEQKSYRQAQNNIKEGLKIVKQMQEERKSYNTAEPKSKTRPQAAPKRRNSMPQMGGGK